MEKVENGTFVRLCFTGKLDDGLIFDKTEKCKPLEVKVGNGGLIEGFENALIGMTPNERKSFSLEPNEAYGERDERLERTFPRSSIPLDFEPSIGQVLVFMAEDGREIPAIVKFIDDEVLIADFNHPLAGRNLSFDVEIAEITNAPGSMEKCDAECCCS